MSQSQDIKLAGVMGWPIAHSLSPRLHSYWLREYGIDGSYLPLPVAPDHLEHALQALPKLGFRGVNLTVPHKEAALHCLDVVDPVASRIGAVNTVFVGNNGKLTGTNTDALGFITNLKDGASGWLGSQGPAVVLGAGGSAHAVVAGLIEEHCPDIRLVNRTRAHAETLARHSGGPVTVYDWNEREAVLEGAALLVNTTILGLKGKTELDINLSALPKEAVVTDLIYTPLITPLLEKAQARGNRIVDGLGMLLHQAVPGFEGWFGPTPVVTEALRSHVLDAV